jgi:hypothetical protein
MFIFFLPKKFIQNEIKIKSSKSFEHKLELRIEIEHYLLISRQMHFI